MTPLLHRVLCPKLNVQLIKYMSSPFVLPHPESPCHVENLNSISLLEAQGFMGPDASLEISLFEYGIAWKEVEEDGKKMILFIYGLTGRKGQTFDRCTIDADTDPEKEWDWVEWKDIQDFCGAGVDFPKGFPLSEIVQSLIQYHGWENVFGDSYWEGFKITKE